MGAASISTHWATPTCGTTRWATYSLGYLWLLVGLLLGLLVGLLLGLNYSLTCLLGATTPLLLVAVGKLFQWLT